jgi:hypothetical protein
MVVGSDQLFNLTKKEVEEQLLKMPVHADFRGFNTHLARTGPEWRAKMKQLEKMEDWAKAKRECPAFAQFLLPCPAYTCACSYLQPISLQALQGLHSAIHLALGHRIAALYHVRADLF